MKKLRVFEAFSGYGSQSIALRNIGVDYEVVAISEIDKYAIRAYEAIHGKTNNLGDISKIDIKDIPEHDLFTYSFPCQDISIAGRQMSLEEGSGTRSSLLWECKKIIEHCKPKYLLMENVKNLISKKHKPYFDKWLDYLESLGYTNYWKVLNAKDYGVPQNRERVFVVSILGEHKPYEFPKGFELTKYTRDILEENVDERYYTSRPFKLVEGNRIKAEFTKVNFDQGKRIHGIDSYFQALGALDRGTNNILIEEYLADDTMQEGGEPKIFTLIEGEKIYKVRKLTPLECWRLMGVSDEDFYKVKNAGISNSRLVRLAGNSIVVDVLEGIFKKLFK